MALPEHVKKQAMDAVAHKETTAQIRLYSNRGAADAPRQDLFSSPKGTGPESREIPDYVKKQGMDAVADKDTTAQIRLVKDSGTVVPQAGSARDTNRVSERIAQMQKESRDVDSVHRTITKDNFERDCG
jgi:hypothetical protein